MESPVPLARRPIKRRKLHEEVADELTRLIVRGHFAPGSALPSEREIMELYGVGRTSVREALLGLQKSGIVSIRNGERAKVTLPDTQFLVGELSAAAQMMLSRPDGVRHFQSVRMLFEAAIARQVALAATSEDIARLEAALAANHAAIGDQTKFQLTDMAFHSALVQCIKNPIFTAIDYALHEWLHEQRSFSAAAGAPFEGAYRGHVDILSAIKAHAPERAQTAMEEHLRFVEEYYWRHSDRLSRDGA